jgi:hypothetical protein
LLHLLRSWRVLTLWGGRGVYGKSGVWEEQRCHAARRH